MTVLRAFTDKMARLYYCEYGGARYEYDSTGAVTRSRKFMTFGIHRIEYPEEEIEECVTYNYARSAVRQLTFNFWQDGIGYGERSIEEIGTGYKDEIKIHLVARAPAQSGSGKYLGNNRDFFASWRQGVRS